VVGKLGREKKKSWASLSRGFKARLTHKRPLSGPARCCDVADPSRAFSQHAGPGRLCISLDPGPYFARPRCYLCLGHHCYLCLGQCVTHVFDHLCYLCIDTAQEPRPTKSGRPPKPITNHLSLGARCASRTAQRIHLGPVEFLFQAMERIIADVAAVTQLIQCVTFCCNGTGLN
jgi:hypothetical protein